MRKNSMLTILKDCKNLALLCKVEGERKIRTQEGCIFEHPRQGKRREKGVLLINYQFPLVPCVNKIRSGLKTNQSCKVEFIQPSNWLYSVPNLLVIQHLVTLYLGGFVVRVVSEIE